jgi:hypothetical protein
MSRKLLALAIAAGASFLTLAHTPAAELDIKPLLTCQKRIAKRGAQYAVRVVKGTLRCTNEVVECQLNCDLGVYGPSCLENPPPCCDSDDRESNVLFDDCMTEADDRCAREEEKIVTAELRKRDAIFAGCDELTDEQLCGTGTPGLNFVTLNAGCEEIIPGYECSLLNMLDCVGGPLEQELAEQIGELLDPRAGEALTAAGIGGFAGIKRVHKLAETLPAGTVDLWSISGEADDQIVVRIKTVDDGDGLSGLEPVMTYLGSDASTPVANTTLLTAPCTTANTCGQDCPLFKRRFPFTGTFFLAVEASTSNGCSGGGYQLVIATEGDGVPVLVSDDADPILP